MLRSKRFIKAVSPASCRISFDHHSVAARRWPARLQQCALLFVARACTLRTCCCLAVATIGLRRDMAIGELDVQTLAAMHVGGAAEHAAFGVAGEREAAGEHVVIAERVEELDARIEAVARPRHQSWKSEAARAGETGQQVAPSTRGIAHATRPEPRGCARERDAMGMGIGAERAAEPRTHA